MATIAPSILASNWGKIEEEVKSVSKAGADWIHLDVMDGKFVPPITFGPDLVKAVKKSTDKVIDVHLMITEPEKQISPFRDAGADIITVHQEAAPHLHRMIQQIKESGAKAGVALNPATPVETISSVINEIDLLLIMTVNPGWGGQKFIPNSAEKIKTARALIEKSKRAIDLQVDGGINKETAVIAKDSGANVLVAGTYIFGSDDYKEAIDSIK